jgi:hypothetical protein
MAGGLAQVAEYLHNKVWDPEFNLPSTTKKKKFMKAHNIILLQS